MGNFEDKASECSMTALLQSLIEGKELERWQQHFCEIAKVFICCVDGQGEELTALGGKKSEADRIEEALDKEQVSSMLKRVSEDGLEDQTIENTAYPNLRVAVISAKAEGRTVMNWLVCGVISNAFSEGEYAMPALTGFPVP